MPSRTQAASTARTPLLYTISETQALGFGSRSTVKRLISRGDLATIKIGRTTRILDSSLRAFLDRAGTDAAAGGR